MAKKWKKPKTSDRGTVFRTLRLKTAHKQLIQNLSPYPPVAGRKTRQEVLNELVSVVASLELPVRTPAERELIRIEFPLKLLTAMRHKSDDTAKIGQRYPTTDILVIAAHEYAKRNGLCIPDDYVSPLDHFDEMPE